CRRLGILRVHLEERGAGMGISKRIAGGPKGPWGRVLGGMLAAGLAVAVVGLTVRHLGNELWALWQGEEAIPEVVSGPALPVDGPAMSVARASHLQDTTAQAVRRTSATEAPAILDEPTFVQFTT